MTYFNTKGENQSGQDLFDRDGFLKSDVQAELAAASINDYPALSDIVRCHFAGRFWKHHPNDTPQMIFTRLK
jgi:hypothetical protein